VLALAVARRSRDEDDDEHDNEHDDEDDNDHEDKDEHEHEHDYGKRSGNHLFVLEGGRAIPVAGLTCARWVPRRSRRARP
jgi:ABC-type Zn2+ transport system substrate-binding protein/surface adhesin